MNTQELHTKIAGWSEELGFVAYGAAPYRQMEMELFENYLSLGFNAGMRYLERNRDIRADINLLLPGASSVLCFLAPYKQKFVTAEGNPKIASYALGKDYHPVIRERLRIILERIKEYMPDANGRVFTDSAPILERSWAAAAGLGFIGRNNFLISREHGLHTLIGIIVLDIPVKYNKTVVRDGCGRCTACTDSCPTGALGGKGQLDASKCISYQTIESKLFRSEERAPVERKGWIFGCDICMEACPWSGRGEILCWDEFVPLKNHLIPEGILSLTKKDWQMMERDKFEEILRDSPLKRAGYEKIMDNLEGL
ncbi:MAG: tRNA epoxyqueuosine(34) reductase QueG [Bacteroidales bacterium]|nr:tRNA epoxyqueuosine(34) reductase QueG [Bacteroidales bacterium]MDD3989223.1 tRNA epoxyqueuosine(34) reductase QueG [Bacteroidales bacterium]MDD4638921.1 tRNA epoxyqueuosine(34) reductase QueG [Bacteroidales bacterium]